MKMNLMNSPHKESGQTFPMVLVILAMGSLFIGGFLSSVNTHFLVSDVYSKPIPDLYAADAGIEDVIWSLQYGELKNEIKSQGGQIAYTINGTMVNGTAAEVTVTSIGDGSEDVVIVAEHDFEDRNWGGGTGWIDPWYHPGAITFISNQNPYQGRYHVQMIGNAAYFDRAVDLTGYSDLYLQFYAKARLLEGNDRMYCLVSSDDTNWSIVQEWDANDDDNQYHYYDISLSSYLISNEFWIAFDSGFNQNTDYFYIDDIKIVGKTGDGEPTQYKIESVSGQISITVMMEITEGQPVIHSWEID